MNRPSYSEFPAPPDTTIGELVSFTAIGTGMVKGAIGMVRAARRLAGDGHPVEALALGAASVPVGALGGLLAAASGAELIMEAVEGFQQKYAHRSE